MGLNILIIDDSATVRAVIKKTLGLAGIPVAELYQAENGREGLDLLAEHWVDLVFCDINMPVMGGIEMIEEMNKNNLTDTVPVIIVSTEGSSTRIDELMNKGVRAYIRKPFEPETIRKVVDDVIGIPNES